jgi:hypothetical protein
VNYYQPLVIKWQARVKTPNDSMPWMPAGTSRNLIYLLLDKPYNIGTPWLLQSFVDYGSRKAVDSGIANAQTQPLPLFNAIWTNFNGRSAKRAADQQPLQYYGSWNTTITSPLTTQLGAALLVWFKDGMCGAWQGLLRSAVFAQGLPHDRTFPIISAPDIVSNQPQINATGGILVNQWTFVGKGSNTQYFPGAFPYVNYVGPPMDPLKGFPYKLANVRRLPRWDGPPFAYLWIAPPEVSYTKGTPAQNNNNPRATFPDHGLIRMNMPPGVVYYDPSYGVTYSGIDSSPALLDFQKKAISGFYIMNNTLNPNIRAMALRKRDDSRTEFTEA